MNLTPTVVSMELVVVDYKVLAEMSDGSLIELSTPWGAPPERDLTSHSIIGWRFKTREQLIELARRLNSQRRDDANYRLHLDKVRRLGWDYASRGY